MEEKRKYIGCSWSGGKDSCYALMKAIERGYRPKVILNMMNENGMISRSHGIPLSIIQEQAKQLDIDLVAIPSSWDQYEFNYISSLKKIKSTYGIEAMVYGDIDLEPHREWEEMVCKQAELNALLPLWQRDRKKLVYEMIERGVEMMIVSCNTQLGEVFLGRIFNQSLIDDLEKAKVDICGENGEFHTIVTNCPIFKDKIELPPFEKITHSDYCFVKWEDVKV